MFKTIVPKGRVAYERNTAVSAGRNLRLVGVDENLGVAEWATATIAADDSGLCPTNGLLVNELNGGHWAGLSGQLISSCVCDIQNSE